MKQYYAGFDLGTKWIYATMIDDGKQIIKEAKFPCNIESVERFFAGMPKYSLNVAMEACGIWTDLYEYLVDRCKTVKVANPLETKWIGSSGKKTDKIDSVKLAELLKADMIREIYVPTREARDYRSKVRHRQSIVVMRTELKNEIHAILRRETSGIRKSRTYSQEKVSSG